MLLIWLRWVRSILGHSQGCVRLPLPKLHLLLSQSLPWSRHHRQLHLLRAHQDQFLRESLLVLQVQPQRRGLGWKLLKHRCKRRSWIRCDTFILRLVLRWQTCLRNRRGPVGLPVRWVPDFRQVLWHICGKIVVSWKRLLEIFSLGARHPLAFDYQQVLHIDRGVNPPDQVDEFGNLPPRHIRALYHLRSIIEELKWDVKLVVVSHIESSSKNGQTLVTALQKSLLPVGLTIVTRQRTGMQIRNPGREPSSTGNLFLGGYLKTGLWEGSNSSSGTSVSSWLAHSDWLRKRSRFFFHLAKLSCLKLGRYDVQLHRNSSVTHRTDLDDI